MSERTGKLLNDSFIRKRQLLPRKQTVARGTTQPAAKRAHSPKAPDLVAKAIGSRLRALRLAQEESSGDDVYFKVVGEALKVTGAVVGKWEKGRGRPTLENLEGLALFWKVHPGWLTFGWEPKYGTAPDRRVEGASTSSPPGGSTPADAKTAPLLDLVAQAKRPPGGSAPPSSGQVSGSAPKRPRR